MKKQADEQEIERLKREQDTASQQKLLQLKKEKSDAIIQLKAKIGRYDREECKKIAVMELKIAIGELERGMNGKSLANMESARRFIQKLDMGHG